MARRRSVIRWVRILHRWISMIFVVLAVLLILPVLPAGPVFDTVTAGAISALLLMIVSGVWMAIDHYILKFRRPRVRRDAPLAAG